MTAGAGVEDGVGTGAGVEVGVLAAAAAAAAAALSLGVPRPEGDNAISYFLISIILLAPLIPKLELIAMNNKY